MFPNPPISIRQWSPEAGAEPFVRIGVILDEDQSQRARIDWPAGAGVLRIDDGASGAELNRAAVVTIERDNGALAYRIDDGPPGRAASLRLVPAAEPPLARDSGALVRDLVVGRGFHWQKRIDQALPGTLELRCGQRGVLLVNELPLESYLAGVITAEMSGACPPALLEAQCIVARSWLLAMTEAKHEHEPFDRCNDDCCQRYQGTGALTDAALAAQRATRGRVLLAPNDQVLDANYSKSCGGISELPQHVWGIAKPGLSAVVDAPAGDPARTFPPITEQNLDDYLGGAWLKLTRCYCSPQVVRQESVGDYLGRVDTVADYFRWTVRYSGAELAALLRARLTGAGDLAAVRDVRVLARGISGRATALEIVWEDQRSQMRRARLNSEYDIRAAMHERFLFSSAFALHATHDAAGRIESLTLRGAGWGHGVGMCQIGALGMALSGESAEAICRHYYPVTRLATVYR